MKYFVLLCDGMADLPLEELGFRTPLEAAGAPVMDLLAQSAYAGMVKTVPDTLNPGSDTANMSVLGYDPELYYTGRSPIEAVSMGIDLAPADVAFRTNLVTLTAEEPYEEKFMADYSSDEISTQEAAEIIRSVNQAFETEEIRFYPGKSYRHCMVWKQGPREGALTPPHDILTRKIKPFLPQDPQYQKIRGMMKESFPILRDHPVNLARMRKGQNPANSIWIWGQGTKPALPKFTDKYGLKGSVVAAVDLIFGLGICAGLDPVTVEGATGNVHTNFSGKADAAIREFEKGQDFIYLHVEAPDECGHRNELENKILSVEQIDQKILKPVLRYLSDRKDKTGEEFRILITPDHPTPIPLRTHTNDPVPFILYTSDGSLKNPCASYSEKECRKTGVSIEKGYTLMDLFIRG